VNRIWAIFAKEIRSYFLSPIAYIVTAGFMVLSGLSFYFRAIYLNQVIQAAYENGELAVLKQNRINHFLIGPMLGDVGLILMFLMPVLTMRLFSEEKRQKTDELLLTSPLTVNQIVISKYLAGLFYAILLVLITLVYMVVLFHYSEPDAGMAVASYLSLVLFVACVVSLGVFTSSLTENQIVASVSCLILELIFATFGVASRSVGSPTISRILAYLSLQTHMKSFLDGVIMSEDLIYFVSFAFLFLFLTNRSVESSRWR